MFKKNLEAIKKVNKILAYKLEHVTIEEASRNLGAIKNEFGEYILTKDNKYVDDTPSPIASAKAIYEEQIKSATSRHDFIVIFGLGLGNLLDYAHTESVAQIVLYEPDINIIRFTCEYVDLTKYFNDGRLYITNNLTDCTNHVGEKYLLEDKIEFLYIKNYVLQKPSEFTVLTERIFEVCQEKIIDMNTIKKMSKVWINNSIKSFTNPKLRYPVNLLENTFKNKTALILGAGPSLKDNIEKIKQNREKFVVFTVHRTLETLRKNGITPDFCVIVDAQWVKDSISKDLEYLKDINFIVDIKADAYIYSLPCKNLFTYFSNNSIIAQKFATKMLGDIKLLEPAGTSTITAYKCAKLSGCKNFVFAGVDLAFKDDTVYCDDKNAVANTQTSVKIQNIVREITEIKSITGEYVKTRADYACFIKQFEKVFAVDKTNVYNLTTFGAFIKGMKYDNLENIISSLNPEAVSSEEILNNFLDNTRFNSQKLLDVAKEVFNEELIRIKPLIYEIDEWFEMYEEHPSFFDYATNIITKITSSMILSDYVQIEILRFTKLVLDKDEVKRKDFILDLFKHIKTFYKNLNNLT